MTKSLSDPANEEPWSPRLFFLVVGYSSRRTDGHQIAILPEISAKVPVENKTVKGDLLEELSPFRVIHDSKLS